MIWGTEQAPADPTATEELLGLADEVELIKEESVDETTMVGGEEGIELGTSVDEVEIVVWIDELDDMTGAVERLEDVVVLEGVPLNEDDEEVTSKEEVEVLLEEALEGVEERVEDAVVDVMRDELDVREDDNALDLREDDGVLLLGLLLVQLGRPSGVSTMMLAVPGQIVTVVVVVVEPRYGIVVEGM